MSKMSKMSKIIGDPDKQWKSYYSQQGDSLIKKIGIFGVFKVEFGKIPDDAIKLESNLVLKGETNSHALYEGEFEILEKDNFKFLRVTKPTILDHVKDLTSMARAEHHAQWIPVGEYFVDQVNEFDHIKEESRKIID